MEGFLLSRYEDGPRGLKVDRDYLEGATREGAFLGSKEVLWAKGQLTASDAYREGWERIFGNVGHIRVRRQCSCNSV